MYTIDEFIERLQNLRSVAPLGGKTPVVIETAHQGVFEVAATQLQPVIELGRLKWGTADAENDMQVLRVF